MGFLLFIIAVFFTTLFTVLWIPISIPYYLITFKWKTGAKKLNRYFYMLAIVVDIFGNESLQTLFNHIMVRRGIGHYPFGDDNRNTISLAIAKNDESKTLNKFGRFWGKFLNFVDKNHLQKAIEWRKQQDLKGIERLRELGYVIDIKEPVDTTLKKSTK